MKCPQKMAALFPGGQATGETEERQRAHLQTFQIQSVTRRSWLTPMLSITSLLLFSCWALATLPRDKYLRKDGKLAATLTLKDLQSGTNGVKGTIWTVRPNGSWDRKQVAGRTTRKPDRSGKLTARQLQQLADVLAHAQVQKLPARLGTFRGAKPHVVTLGWRKQQCVWTLPPGIPVPKYPDQPFGKLTHKDCFAEVAQILAKLLQPPKKK